MKSKYLKSFILICYVISFPIAIYSIEDDDKSNIIESSSSVRSYGGNYVVIAPDTETAALYAKLAEDIRKQVANFFSDESKENIITYVILKSTSDEDAESAIWDVSFIHGKFKNTFQSIDKNRIEAVLKYVIVYNYILDIAIVNAKRNNASIHEGQIPIWICAGVIENLTADNRESYRNFIYDAIEKGSHIPIEKIFLHDGEFKSEQERALYFHQCGSLIDYLINIDSGRKRILESIKRLWEKGDLAITLIRQFDNEFSTIPELERNWISFVNMRKEILFDFKRLPNDVVQARLSEILKVEIVALDKKTIEEKNQQTDFEGLMEHKNKSVRTSIALKKIGQLQDLKLRSSNEFHQILDEYILSLKAIIEGKKNSFKNHYKKANSLLKNFKSK